MGKKFNFSPGLGTYMYRLVTEVEVTELQSEVYYVRSMRKV